MKRDQYRKEHEMDFNIHFGAKRILNQLLKDSQDKTLHIAQWKEEAERLSAEYSADYEELKKQREESKELFRIQAQIDSVLKEQERNRTQQAEQQKKNDRNINWYIGGTMNETEHIDLCAIYDVNPINGIPGSSEVLRS